MNRYEIALGKPVPPPEPKLPKIISDLGTEKDRPNRRTINEYESYTTEAENDIQAMHGISVDTEIRRQRALDAAERARERTRQYEEQSRRPIVRELTPEIEAELTSEAEGTYPGIYPEPAPTAEDLQRLAQMNEGLNRIPPTPTANDAQLESLWEAPPDVSQFFK